MNKEQMEHIRTHCFYVESPCGRAWEVPMIHVLRDYMIFQMQMERQDGGNRSRNEVLREVSTDDVEHWFHDQYHWDLVEKQGRLVRNATPEQIQEALDWVRSSSQVIGDKINSPQQRARLAKRRLTNVANKTCQTSKKENNKPKI